PSGSMPSHLNSSFGSKEICDRGNKDRHDGYLTCCNVWKAGTANYLQFRRGPSAPSLSLGNDHFLTGLK
ncbi:MAG TPA: hypothetical protein DEQ32_11520, partial [Gammaproteobacteria bacterium]|nr:hypothetical protein [Gammaproteobacteria bacterium]